jgi:hypothetical protein
VECADHYHVAGIADHFDDSFLHLAAGFVGEGHSQNLVGIDSEALDGIGDLGGDDAGLSASGPSKDQERTFVYLHSLKLLFVELT